MFFLAPNQEEPKAGIPLSPPQSMLKKGTVAGGRAIDQLCSRQMLKEKLSTEEVELTGLFGPLKGL